MSMKILRELICVSYIVIVFTVVMSVPYSGKIDFSFLFADNSEVLRKFYVFVIQNQLTLRYRSILSYVYCHNYRYNENIVTTFPVIIDNKFERTMVYL